MKGLAELNYWGCVWEDGYQSTSYFGAVPVKPDHLAFLPAVDLHFQEIIVYLSSLGFWASF